MTNSFAGASQGHRSHSNDYRAVGQIDTTKPAGHYVGRGGAEEPPAARLHSQPVAVVTQ